MAAQVLTQNFDISLVMRDLLEYWNTNDSLLKLLPVSFKDTSKVVWEQRDNFYGLMPLRGLNGTPDILPLPGSKRYSVDPGYYGGEHLIGEEEMTKQRELGTANETIDLEMLVSDAVMSLTAKIYNRLRQTIATLLTTGEFKNENRGGSKVHSYKVDGYNLASTATAWSNPAVGTPIADIQALQNTYQLGTSSAFGAGSKILMQQYLANLMMQTAEVKSVIKNDGGATPKGLGGLNTLLTSYGLPTIEIYNEGYAATLTASQTPSLFTRFLPTNKFIWVGTRPNNAPIGEWVMTRNMVNQKSASAAPDYRTDFFEGPEDLRRGIYEMVRYEEMPPTYLIDAGFNGGPTINYRTAAIGVTVG